MSVVGFVVKRLIDCVARQNARCFQMIKRVPSGKDLIESKARSKRRSIHAPNLTNELSTAVERRLNRIGSAV